MDKKVEILPDVPEEVKHVKKLEALLDYFNSHPNRIIPESEIKNALGDKFDGNTLTSASGIPESSVFISNNELIKKNNFERATYYANLAKIRETSLIKLWPPEVGGTQGYTITPRGIEVLNELQLNKNIIKFNESSDRASRAIAILTIFLVALAAIQILLFIDSQPALAMYETPTEIVLAVIMFGVIVVERNMLFSAGNKKPAKNESGEKTQRSWISILIIGSVITLGLIIGLWALFKYDNWSVATIRETIIGVIVAYALFVYGLILKDLILPIQTKIFAWLEKGCMKDRENDDKKRRLILVPIAVFLRAIPIIIVIAWVALDFASAGVTQTVTYEVLGGITGAWALGLFFKDFGINPE